MPEPIYYLGWIVQPTRYGCFVYDRRDHSVGGVGKLFAGLGEAFRFIGEVSR